MIQLIIEDGQVCVMFYMEWVDQFVVVCVMGEVVGIDFMFVFGEVDVEIDVLVVWVLGVLVIQDQLCGIYEGQYVLVCDVEVYMIIDLCYFIMFDQVECFVEFLWSEFDDQVRGDDDVVLCEVLFDLVWGFDDWLFVGFVWFGLYFVCW